MKVIGGGGETHVDEAVLLEYLSGLLDEARQAQVEAHVDDCPACTEHLARLTREEIAIRDAARRVLVRPRRRSRAAWGVGGLLAAAAVLAALLSRPAAPGPYRLEIQRVPTTTLAAGPPVQDADCSATVTAEPGDRLDLVLRPEQTVGAPTTVTVTSGSRRVTEARAGPNGVVHLQLAAPDPLVATRFELRIEGVSVWPSAAARRCMLEVLPAPP